MEEIKNIIASIIEDELILWIRWCIFDDYLLKVSYMKNSVTIPNQ